MTQPLQILVLDDTPQVIAVLRLALRRFLSDCQLFEAENVEEAKSLFEQHPDIALVISDFHLEDGTGLEFREWIQQRRKVAFLLMSGTYSFTQYEPFEFVPKPLQMEELQEKVERLLGEQLRGES